MAGAISVSRNPVIGRKIFQCISSHLDSSLDLDANRLQMINHHFDLNSYSYGVKIEVKQVTNNYTWLYNENQYRNCG